MKTITKFMTLCALFVGVNVSAQTYITSFPHSETFEEGVPTAFEGGSVVSATQIGSVFTANTSTEVGTALFDGDQSTDGAQAITVGETDVFTISYTSYFGWLNNGKEATFSVKNSDGIELISYGYNTGSEHLTTVKICGGNNLLETPIFLRSKYNDSKPSNGLTHSNHYRNIEDYNTKVTIVIAKSSASITFVNPSRGVNTTLSASIGSDVKVDLVSINLGNETANADRGPAIDNMTITKETAQSSTYTLKKVCSGVELSTEELNGFVGNEIVVKEDAFFNSDKTKKYFYVSDDSEGKTIASDGSTVVTVTYREAETYSCSVKSSTDVVLAEGSNFEGEIFNYSYPKYLTDANGKVTHKIDGLTTFSASVVLSENIDIQVPYTEYIGEAYYVEVEDKVSGTVGNNSKLSKGSAVRAFKPVLVFTVPFDGIYSIEYGAYTNNVNHESYFVLNDGEADVWTSQNVQNSINYYEVFIDEGITFAKGKELTLSSLSTNPYIDYMLFVVSKNTPISDINADKAVDNDYYDLSGRKVVNPVKGNIYINGGKLIRY